MNVYNSRLRGMISSESGGKPMKEKEEKLRARRVYAREGAPIDKVLVRYLASQLGVRR